MKKVFFIILFVGAASYANAQKTEVAEAKKIWGIFELTMSVDPAKKSNAPAAASPGGTFIQKQILRLTDGLSHIDKAIVHDKTKDLPETWVYKALFHSTISAVDTLNIANSKKNQKMAEEAIAKAKSLDLKNEFKDPIAQAEGNIDVALSSRGIMAYNKKDYAIAYENFILLAEKKQTDPSWFLNAAVAANLMSNYPEAIKNFKKVISFNTPDAQSLYFQVIGITLDKLKDTTSAMTLLDEAIAKYPDDNGLIGTQTDIYIIRGDIAKSQASLAKLIAKDPNKAVYQYLMGETYYKQALLMQEERKKIDLKKVKEFDAISAKMLALIDKSLPFYQKSHELDPKFVSTLETLKQIYGFKNDTANFNDIKKKLDAIPQN
ncbi:MAG: tetratricopeptide repeat protein [Pedobacter sp.]|nr:tetratricopeptide repeat protein [Pedobacter sp.]